jgi:protein-tyrosine phosphatase
MNRYNRVVTSPFEKVFNFRDIGGLRTKEGNFMKSGVLFRSDHLSKITDNDWKLLQKFNIKVICDLRTPKECSKKPSPLSLKKSINMINIPLHTDNINRIKLMKLLFSKTGEANFEEFRKSYYHHIAFNRTNQIKEIISILSHKKNLPALIHCTAGKDRTGYISICPHPASYSDSL